MKLYRLHSANRVAWRKSSFCVQGECAEVARRDNVILMRSSISPRKLVRYRPEEFKALLLGMRAGEFDDLA